MTFNDLEEPQRNLITRHLELVMERNKSINLTRINDLGSGMLLHVEDSLAGLEELDRAPQGVYADLGTGGGFPGIPLAIVSGRSTVLVDARQKKIKVLEEIIKDLGLEVSISTYAGRIEALSNEKRGQFAVVTARALSKTSVLMELSSPLLFKGGILICYKANMGKDEYDSARRLEKITGMKLVSDRSFCLSDGGTRRRILCFEKMSNSQIKLPRQDGFAQNHPL